MTPTEDKLDVESDMGIFKIFIFVKMDGDGGLTGMDELRFAPPIRVPLWKFLGKTFLPNLWSLSLFHEIPFLFTGNCWLMREKL